MSNYDDIIDLEYPFKSNYKKMSMLDRSAQFAPFAALTGYDDAVKEAARLTDKKKELSEDELAYLDSQLQELENNIKNKPFVTITYFLKDAKKAGGKYIVYAGQLSYIDIQNQTLNFVDKKKIKITNIVDIKIS